MSNNKQVFQSATAKRWNRVSWGSRVFMFFIVLGIVAIAVAVLSKDAPFLPKLVDQANIYRKVLNPEAPTTIKTKSLKELNRLRRRADSLDKRIKANRNGNTLPLANQIRAGYFVNWDPSSLRTLQDRISHLNMVLPEWIFLTDSSDRLFVNVDEKALAIMKQTNHKKVAIIPMITNNYQSEFKPEAMHRLLNSPSRKMDFINQVEYILKKYDFQGINIDFEEMSEESDEPLNNFMKEVYTALHAKGYLVTQDIAPLNVDYNLDVLQKYNDYIFVMAYDHHYATSLPGPIADQKWVDTVLEDISNKVPASKLILNIAAYGYDWPKGGQGQDVTYQEALTTARESDGKVKYDNNTFNLYFNYADDEDIEHDVYFTDAATCFNAIRTAEDFGLAGVALWRMGGEDSRLWRFYDWDLSYKKADMSDYENGNFDTIGKGIPIDYIGQGEVLDVLSTPQPGKITAQFDTIDKTISEESYDQLPSSYVVKKYGLGVNQMILTFDDGPDQKYTPEVLKILKQENVPATFFVVGIAAQNNVPLLKKIYQSGYEIGNHTYTHPNIAEISKDRAQIELSSTRRLIECITGHSTVLFRPPYNADAEPQTLKDILPVALSKKDNYYTIGESIDPRDWEKGITADSIVARCIAQEKNGSMILLHDAGGNREATVEALPRIIHYFKSKGYTFTTVSALLHKTRDQVMPPVKHDNDYYLTQIDWGIAEGIYWGARIIFSLFFLGIFLSIGRMLFMGVLAWIQMHKSKGIILNTAQPRVSVIVPAYNEEVNAVKTIRNLLESTYPDFDIIFVDDGSKDETFSLVSGTFGTNPKVKVITKPNGGKASALNYGISQSNADYVVCIDADTQLRPDAIAHLMAYFVDENTAAVAGNVKVGNENSLITGWQSIEYTTSQNFDRRAFDLLNCITVVPGAIGVFNKEILIEAGGLTSDTLAEDCDLTIRILKKGYRVRYSPKAVAVTEAPETMNMFMKQRFRWSYGIMQSFWKNRDAVFNPKYGALGWIALPNILIFQILLPLISPLADLFMIFALVFGNAPEILFYYVLFMAVDTFGAMIAFYFEKENPRKLWMLIPQRLVYRQLMYYILFKSIRRAIKGESVSWGTLKRTGSVVQLGTENAL
jgi:cellulose synthase/poly-beta-1,6-N-acetylglucosamine synthase-like glycosyltransferase/spore germination protein YaaH/peptidoglycan/xylan/chitin deacetylase (PgdA/CDA1 family)